MARNGTITLSYARSAGTGDQPVPGTVTARRAGNRHERQATIRKRQEEDEKERRQKDEQDQIAKILAHKWAEEDRKKSSRRRRDESRLKDDSDDDEERGRRLAKEDGEDLAGSVDDQEDNEEAGERVAGWVTFERRGGPVSAAPMKQEKEVLQQLEATRPKAGSVASSDSRSSQARRFTEAGGNRESDTEVASTASAFSKGKSASSIKVDTAKAHSVKVANVFGFGADDEDEDATRREMELAARSKRAKLSLHTDATKALGDSHGGFMRDSQDVPLSSSSSSASAKQPADMCQQLMKMAQWKRSCGGKRLPMPKDLEAEVAKAMGSSG